MGEGAVVLAMDVLLAVVLAADVELELELLIAPTYVLCVKVADPPMPTPKMPDCPLALLKLVCVARPVVTDGLLYVCGVTAELTKLVELVVVVATLGLSVVCG